MAAKPVAEQLSECMASLQRMQDALWPLNVSNGFVIITRMNPEYFETHFDPAGFDGPWPFQFAMITAYATTGEQWLPDVNEKANVELKIELLKLNLWTQRVTGFSPKTGHSEPGWAVELSFSDACDLGQRFRQDAIYFVRGDQLFVSQCDERRKETPAGSFRDRLRR